MEDVSIVGKTMRGRMYRISDVRFPFLGQLFQFPIGGAKSLCKCMGHALDVRETPNEKTRHEKFPDAILVASMQDVLLWS